MLINRIVSIIISATALSIHTPAMAASQSFDCNTVGNLHSKVHVIVNSENSVITGNLALRAVENDKQYPAYGLVRFHNSDQKVTLKMTAIGDNRRSKIELVIDRSGVEESYSFPNFEDYSRKLEYTIWVQLNGNMVIQLDNKAIVIPSPFQESFNIILACAGSGSYRIEAHHKTLEKEEEQWMSMVKPSNNLKVISRFTDEFEEK